MIEKHEFIVILLASNLGLMPNQKKENTLDTYKNGDFEYDGN